ncbi:MAG: hypothetical protein K6A72_01425 [Lachnospiraceae bacterium]|nr:hypothetical protein [Lachnospiraceae bacterium]
MKKRGLRLAGIMMGLVLLGGCAGNSGNSSQPIDEQEEVEVTEETAENDDDENGTEESGDPAGNQDVPAALSQEDYESIYAPVIDEVNAVIEEGYDYEKQYTYLSDGLIEKIMYGVPDTLPDEIGYVLEDVSGDGVPELLLGFSDAYESGEQEWVINDYVVGVYTIKDDQPFMVIEGWARNSYRMMDDGHFFNLGSGGATNTIIGECHLSEDGTEVIWDDFFFTEARADGTIAIFSNDSGDPDRNDSDELDIGEEEFEQIMGEYELRCELIAWYPIRGYGNHEKDDVDQSYVSEDEAMYLYQTYYNDPTDENWDAFMAKAPKDAVLFIITNPPAGLEDFARSPVAIDGSAFDTVVAVALTDNTKLELGDGDVSFTDDGEVLWTPSFEERLYTGSLNKGDYVAFRMVLPEGVPSRALSIYTPDAEGIFLVATLSGEWDQHSTFISAN